MASHSDAHDDDSYDKFLRALNAGDSAEGEETPATTQRRVNNNNSVTFAQDHPLAFPQDNTLIFSPQDDVVEIAASSLPSSQEEKIERGRSTSELSDRCRIQAQLAAGRARPTPDAEILAKAVADAGLNAFGCVFVEMWVLSDNGTQLLRPEGGHWMNPAFATSLPSEDLIEQAWGLDRVAEPSPPGAGLAGILADESGLGSGQVHWRQIRVLLTDPFVQRGSGRRMERMDEVGISLVASVPFSFVDAKGLVLFFSRKTADPKRLQNPANLRYMISSANLIGAGYSIRRSRDHTEQLRRQLYLRGIGKVKRHIKKNNHSIFSLVSDEGLMHSLRANRAQEEANEDGDGPGRASAQEDLMAVKIAKKAHRCGLHSLKRIKNSGKKWRGSNLHGPPRQPLSACAFAFVGIFLTMLAVLAVEKTLEDNGSPQFKGSWYASTLCILFALTPAPVGQPRQIVAAHLWCFLVGMAFQQIPHLAMEFDETSVFHDILKFGLPSLCRQSLAVALGVSGQAFMGILHPPATGLALAFATNENLTWSSIWPILVVDVLVVLMSMVILNLSEKQQYPLWWFGLGHAATGGSMGHLRSVARRKWRSFLEWHFVTGAEKDPSTGDAVRAATTPR